MRFNKPKKKKKKKPEGIATGSGDISQRAQTGLAGKRSRAVLAATVVPAVPVVRSQTRWRGWAEEVPRTPGHLLQYTGLQQGKAWLSWAKRTFLRRSGF